MNTPICDFVQAYAAGNPVRMHMPGHKGRAPEESGELDLTEIEGADELYHARGIIRESEENAAALFDAGQTLYSAEGSSLCIRAMLYLVSVTARGKGLPRRLLAGRNAHRALMTAAALLDLEIDWLLPEGGEPLLSGLRETTALEEKLSRRPYMAVFLTSPDYLGGRADIRAASAVCRRYGVPLLVDNAHGAYLRFLPADEHPLSLGADACCDSAHKTLCCLTGAAYLHLSRSAPEGWAEQAEQAMALFASTSPSWLILQSLDRMNRALAGTYPERLREAVRQTTEMKKALAAEGWTIVGSEPMKLTLRAAAAGYSGVELQAILRREGIECEFADREYLVMMPSAETGREDWRRLRTAFSRVPLRPPLETKAPPMPRTERVLSLREAMLAPSRSLPVERAVGEVLADAAVSCPPAVPVMLAGERITEEAAACMRYYGVETCRVVIRP